MTIYIYKEVNSINTENVTFSSFAPLVRVIYVILYTNQAPEVANLSWVVRYDANHESLL